MKRVNKDIIETQDNMRVFGENAIITFKELIEHITGQPFIEIYSEEDFKK